MYKFISKIISNFKEIFKPFEAKTLLPYNVNNINGSQIFFLKNRKSNKKIKYYIIRRSPGAGLFSNLIFVLNHLIISGNCRYIPIVDMEHFVTIYNEKNTVNNTRNAWNYYFDNKNSYNLKKIYSKENFILTSNKFGKNFSHKIANKKFRNIFKKYFKIKKKYLDFAKGFEKKNFSNQKVLALYLRGTSYKTSANHPLPITKEQSLNLIRYFIKKKKFTKVFLCTEDLNYFNAITYEFGDKIIYMKNNYRSFIDNAFKNYPRKLHRFKLGEEILLEALIMSKCNSFLYTNSNVSEFVKFLDNKKKINYFLIDNGFNSSNEYLARWLWYCKNILPKFLGGFDKVTNVKKI